MTKCEKLKNLINSKELSFLMECHSGLSAKIIEETGFKGGWISGLSLSAMAGVRDRNELSFKEVADLCYYICSRVDIPMLLDMDTGYGDFNTASTAIRMIESAGVAGVCIEDKKFPKHNSFLVNSSDDLEDPYVFGSKIKALHEATSDPNFVVVARLEGFISGQGLEETYRRACIYEEYGADAILVHSKINTVDQIVDFMEKWKGHSAPVVIVPTKYYKTPTDVFRSLGIRLVIWANHNLRASLSAMQTTSREIYEKTSLMSVEDKIAPVSEVFRIQKDEEVAKVEDEYNPPASGSVVVLSGLANHGVPKCLTRPYEDEEIIIDRYYEGFRQLNINAWDVLVVLGEGAETFIPTDVINYEINHEWDKTTENYSLKLGIDALGDRSKKLPLYIIYGDLSLRSSVFTKMSYLGRDSDIAIAYTKETDPNDYNEYVKGYPIKESSDEIQITSVCHDYTTSVQGSSIGFIKINTAKAAYRLIEILENNDISKSPCVRLDYVLNLLCRDFKVTGIKIRDDEWLDVNE